MNGKEAAFNEQVQETNRVLRDKYGVPETLSHDLMRAYVEWGSTGPLDSGVENLGNITLAVERGEYD